MSKKADKLLERMRRSKDGWRRTDLDTLYKGFGFIIKIKKKGPHDTVEHPDFPQFFTYLPRHRKLAKYIVNQAIKMIDSLKALQVAEKEEHQDDE